MNEMHTTLDRLERRIEAQSARIDDLYALLELHGIRPSEAEAGRGDALFDAEPESRAVPSRPETPRRSRRRVARFHVGEATGV